MKNNEILFNRAYKCEYDNPLIVKNDYDKLYEFKLPSKVKLTKNDESNLIVKTKTGKKQFFTHPIAFINNDFKSIGNYLLGKINNGEKVWVRRIYNHGVGNKYTILECININL